MQLNQVLVYQWATVLLCIS